MVFISGLLKNGEVDPSATVSQESLAGFASFCQMNQTIIEETIGNELRKDMGVRAAMQLNKLLKMAGLTLVSCGRKTNDGVQTREYRLEPRRLALMSRLASNYRVIEARSSNEQSHGRSWAA